MLIDPRLEDYYAALFSFYGIQVLVHGNQEYPEISARGILLSPLKEAFLQVGHYLVSTSASIHSFHTRFCPYQQVSMAPTFIYICISKFQPTQLSFISVSASIHSHSPHWYLYQQLFTASTLIFICIITYRQPEPSFLSVSASIQYPHSVLFVSANILNPKPHLCLYQQVSCPSTFSCLFQPVPTATALTGICISNYSLPPHSILSVSSSIHSPNPHFYLNQQVSCPSTLSCLYHQVSTGPTAICICISTYPVSQHPSFSVSSSIHSPNRQFYLYQQVSRVSTPNFFCISKYPQAQPPFVSISACIQCLNTQVFLYQQVSTGPTLLYICISQYPQPQASLYLYQQVSAASTYSTPEVRALNKEQRQCLFEDEQPLKIANSSVSRYSYSNCLVQCRLEHMDTLCHCSPYFYPTGGSLFVDLRGHIITKHCCEFGHHRRIKASVTSLSV